MIEPMPAHPPSQLAAVAEYCNLKCRSAGDVPRLADIDLMDIYPQAPYLFIADRLDEVDADGQSVYRWRYWGTAVRDLTGIEATGKLLHETHETQGATEAAVDYDAVLTELRASYWKRNVRTVAEDRSYLVYERVVFPLRGADGTPRHILGVFTTNDPEYSATRTGEQLSRAKIGLYEVE